MYLFIHGTGATNSFWIPQIRSILSLDEKYTDASLLDTFTLALPGHPNNDKNFSLEDTEEIIKDIFSAKQSLQLKLANQLILTGNSQVVAGLRSDKIILIGHSVGGVIALNFAMKNASLVEKLVLISTPNQFNLIEINFLDWFYNNFVFKRSQKFLKWLQGIVVSVRWRTALQIFIENPKRRGFKSLLKIVKEYDFDKSFRKLTLDDQLKLLLVPILAISGSGDWLVSSAEVNKIGKSIQNYAEIARSKKTIINLENNNESEDNFHYKLYKGAGHNAMDDDLVSFVYDFREFLKG